MVRRSAHLMVVASLLCCTLVHADSARFDPATMIRASEVERGAQGYGLSVFSGVTIERFELEVLGVLSKAILGEDMILARITTGPVVERESGIIGGMSGSPVYINGKLLGAVAYGWGFSREPICGITPIEAMLDAHPGDNPQALLPGDHPLRGALVDGRWVTEARIEPITVAREAFGGPNTINMQPVAPLIYASGLQDAGMEVLREFFEPYGIEPMVGPGQMRDSVPAELVPGAAVGVTFATGTFDITGIGTLTWREGNDVLAFGHPMMALGPVELPMTTAWVHEFIPSMSRSNKLASSMEPAGALLMDGNWSIGGTIGHEAPTIPAHFVVTDEDRDITREFDFEVARQQLVTPGILMSVLAGALETSFSPGTPGVGTIDFVLRGEKGAEITRRDVVWHPGMLRPITGWVSEAVGMMTRNRFQPQQIASLEARVSITGVDRSAAVERIYTEESVARAGKPLNIHVVLRPEGADPIEKVVTLQMPENLPKGQIRVGAGAGAEEWSIKSRLRLMMPQMNSIDDIAVIIRDMKRADQLYAAVALPEITLAVQGTELPHLPLSMAESMADAARTDMDAGYTELGVTLPTDYVLYGWEAIRIPTEDRQGERGKVSGKDAGDEDDEDGLASAAAANYGLERLWWAASALDRGYAAADDTDLDLDLDANPEDAINGALDDDDEDLLLDDDGDDLDDEADVFGHPEPDGDALTRQLSDWTQDDADDFESGDAEGVLVRSDGTVLLAPAATVLAEVDEPYIWSVAAAGDAVWFGTANPGRIYRWTEADGAKLVHDTGQFMVVSLLPLEDGGLLAGTGPGGKIFRVAADGSAELAWDLPVSYVWSLLGRADGSAAAGTGPGGRIYTLADEASVITTISQPHVLDMVEVAGTLYAAGGSDRGGVYRVSASGSSQDVLGTDEESCTSLAAGPDGTMYVGTASDGKILSIAADGTVAEIFEGEEDVLGVCVSGGNVWAATADVGKIITVDGERRSGIAYEDDVAARVLAITAANGAVYAATANPARLVKLDLQRETTGSYSSAVLDAERVSRWAHLFWDAVVPEGATIAINTCSGNSEVAEDGSWGPWTEAYAQQGAEVGNAPARYLQYRLKMTGSAAAGPELRRLTVLYLPSNQRPEIEIDEPEPGEAIRSDYDISWTTDDDDDDTLVTTIFMRAHGADEWEQLAEVQDEESWEWDTTEVEDGRYSLKLVCSDRPSNAINPLSAEVTVDTITVDQSYPELVIIEALKLDGDEPRVLKALARDDLSRITSVDWRVGDEGEWRAATPDDGLLSSTRELFTITIEELPEDAHMLEVRLRDSADNVTVETLPLDSGDVDEGDAGEGDADTDADAVG